MTIQLYNTLTKRKEPFQPLDPANVRMYVCGPTVYDEAHIGNARPVIVFDVLFRLLRHVYGENHVTYVRNLTDIDDKINRRAFERWDKKRPLLQEIRALTEKTAAQFHADVDALGNLRPTHEPRATEYVCDGEKRTDMVRIIEKLIARGHAYVAQGHVLFDVPSMPAYGRLARRTRDDMIAGARVDVAPYKKDPMDFVLWKPSDPATEPGWESPWGFGRPGWHIECSAMSGALLGETFDIHAGGIDLIFPHHENEIAQSCCAFGVDKMASVWMHNGFLQVEGEKMSKSLGNFYTIRELLHTDKFGGRSWIGPVLRLTMLKTHYRQPIDWTLDSLEEAQAEFRNFAAIVRNFAAHPTEDEHFIAALADDLNTPLALTRLRELREQAVKGSVEAGRKLLGSLRLFGFFESSFALKLTVSGYEDYNSYLENALNQLASDVFIEEVCVRAKSHWPNDSRVMALSRFSKSTVVADLRSILDPAKAANILSKFEELSEKRLAARAAKNWAESDRIRDELSAQGIILKDNKDGTTTWEVKR